MLCGNIKNDVNIQERFSIMAFYNKINNVSNFSVSFIKNLRNDFGVWGRGYFNAASKLAMEILSNIDTNNSFADYDVYPIVFLYRHSLELYLKNIIYKSALILAFKNIPKIDTKLYNLHNLKMLSEKATEILQKLFSKDQRLKQLSEKILQISSEFSEIDPNSYSYRYPIDINGNAATKPNQIVNLEAFHNTMRALLSEMEVIDFGLDLEKSKAQELYEILTDL